MKPFALTAIVAVLLHAPAWSAEAPPVDSIKAVAGGYAGQLKNGLLEQVSKNGPEGGIAACSAMAAQLGAETSAKTGWSIKRVSSKARNPLAMPDAYEQEVLNGFEKEIASGKEDASRYEVVREGGVRYARFMKAIRIEPLCLTCQAAVTCHRMLSGNCPKNIRTIPPAATRWATCVAPCRSRSSWINQARKVIK